MPKKSKLSEKATRMPDIDMARNEMAIETYLREIGNINSEPAKSQRFTLLLQALFGVEPGFIEEYVQGIETYLKMKGRDRIIRGQADQLSGNLIIEFERDLSSKAKIAESEDQLRRYTACAWAQEGSKQRRKFICLAADGRRFKVYAPIIKAEAGPVVEPEDVELRTLEELDAQKTGWEKFYFFLDRYLLRKEVLHPTSDNIIKDFGPNSHAFQVAQDALLNQWAKLRDHPDYGVLYEAWEKYLRIVYGSSVADEVLFIRHTYLATLAKLMVWSRLASREGQADEREIVCILEGSYFKDQMGIENFLEEDFFSWVARKEARDTTLEITRPIIRLLGNYNLREISEDVLKALYEGLVDPATRHELGEYYTPDWLAHRIVRKMMEPNPKASILDPSCGSGTFLYMAIHEKRQLLGDSAQTLRHICGAVVGLDIHPLACIEAKANYVLALGDLMSKRRRKIGIPVYLANSIRPPELELEREFWQKVECYKTEIDGHGVHIPQVLIEDPEQYDQAIEAAREFAVHAKGQKVDWRGFDRFLRTHYAGLVEDADTAHVLFSAAETLKEMSEAGRDTIWAFVLKNIYKPLFLNERFDIVVGNPPWLSYRYLERSDYQRFLKEQITKRYALVSGRAELITHLELGTLFLVRTVELYLKPRGRIGFVLPKSIFSADQHDTLRRGQVVHGRVIKTLEVSPSELWDLEHVEPLFRTSSAVYFGEKRKSEGSVKIVGEIVRGVLLEGRNTSLQSAEEVLTSEKTHFNLAIMGKRSYWTSGRKVEITGSRYRALFREGASIVPRCFWFVDKKDSEFGFDEDLPPLISSQRARKLAKEAYKDCVIEGVVEKRFIYRTLLSADLLPFGYIRLREVVLPAAIRGGELRIINSEEARREGFIHLGTWIERAQNEWTKRRGERAENMSCLDRLNYQRLLVAQKPEARYRIMYASSGTNVCACVVCRKDVVNVGMKGTYLTGFIADYKTYYLELIRPKEAQYLASILNAPIVNTAIKGAQSRGLWGARDICKKILDLPIPIFNEKSDEHLQLAEIGMVCADRVKKWIDADGPGNIRSIGVLRRNVRELLSKELVKIDSIVKPMMGL